ncbi:hypothetical protein IWX49DRAFT_551747 [Phyllosticta citricarpa]|uniref:Uncharacterized protein n=1 Tax=Phyllosticta citricarpa TaxID=55181 RepID=A0ABR1M6T8_9PEZI
MSRAEPSSTSSSGLRPAPSREAQRFDASGSDHLCHHLLHYNQSKFEPGENYALVQGASDTCGHDISVPQETRDKIVEGDIESPRHCMECLIDRYRSATSKLCHRLSFWELRPRGQAYKNLRREVREKMMDIGNLQLLQDNRADWEDCRAAKMTARRAESAGVKRVAFVDNDVVETRDQQSLDDSSGTTADSVDPSEDEEIEKTAQDQGISTQTFLKSQNPERPTPEPISPLLPSEKDSPRQPAESSLDTGRLAVADREECGESL